MKTQNKQNVQDKENKLKIKDKDNEPNKIIWKKRKNEIKNIYIGQKLLCIFS